jgi:predicted transcriptional regulator
MVTGYFDGSFNNLVSFFAKENNMKVQDIDQLVQELEKIKTKKP